MENYSENLTHLLEKVRKNLVDIPEDIEQAFLDTPRHLFVDTLFDKDEAGEHIEIAITEKNVAQYFDRIYEDRAMGLVADEVKEKLLSSISQPTIVLLMLKHLEIKKEQNVLEIGTASGWNAVLMSKLVGEKGHVSSIELIPDLVTKAQKRIAVQNIKNVSITEGDGAFGVKNKSFDRIMFTVGSYDIPNGIYSQLKENGLLLMVLKIQGINDCLILLKKSGDHLESISNSACRFVSLAGEYAMSELDPINLDSLKIWEELKDQVVQEQAFWWGIKSTRQRDNIFKINSITSFLAIVEPEFKLFMGAEYSIFFGLISEKDNSIALWRDDKLIGYGNKKAFQKMQAAFELYLALGMPNSNCFNLKVYPIDQEIKLSKNQWLIKRRDSQFLWSLN